MDEYPRILTSSFTPFDPLLLAKETEKIVCSGDARKYTDFYCTGVYGGISTGYLVGCCLRCIFCWVDFSRDYPEIYDKFYTPEEVARKLVENARKSGIRKVRISGGEPTINKEHLLKVLDLVEKSGLFFILETNGILLGSEPDYLLALKKYHNLYLRISLKAGTAKGFEKRTGAIGKFYELPYKAVEQAIKEKLYFRVACMSDPRLMPPEEKREMCKKLKSAGYYDFLEEEICDPYETSIIRLRKAGYSIF